MTISRLAFPLPAPGTPVRLAGNPGVNFVRNSSGQVTMPAPQGQTAIGPIIRSNGGQPVPLTVPLSTSTGPGVAKPTDPGGSGTGTPAETGIYPTSSTSSIPSDQNSPDQPADAAAIQASAQSALDDSATTTALNSPTATSWWDEQTLISGYNNWEVTGAGAVGLLLLGLLFRRKR